MAFEYIGPLLQESVQTTTTVDVRGRVEQVVGTIIRAVVPGVKVGVLCILKNPWENFDLKAEVVGFIKKCGAAFSARQLSGGIAGNGGDSNRRDSLHSRRSGASRANP